jgi:hypothetical protein
MNAECRNFSFIIRYWTFIIRYLNGSQFQLTGYAYPVKVLLKEYLGVPKQSGVISY